MAAAPERGEVGGGLRQCAEPQRVAAPLPQVRTLLAVREGAQPFLQSGEVAHDESGPARLGGTPGAQGAGERGQVGGGTGRVEPGQQLVGGGGQVPRGGRGEQHGLRAGRADRGARRVRGGLRRDVGAGDEGVEEGGGAQPGDGAVAGLRGQVDQGAPGVLPVPCGGAFAYGREFTVPQLQDGRGQGGDAGGGPGVADPAAGGLPGLAQADGNPGGAVRRDGAGASRRGGAQHRVDRVAGGERGPQRAQHESADTLARAGALPRGVQQQFDSPGHGGGALAAAQRLDGQMDGGQSRTPAGVDGLDGPGQAEQPGDPAGRVPRPVTEGRAAAARPGFGTEERVVGGGDPGEDSDGTRAAVGAGQGVE
ncbi:hypothetical protein MWG58_32270 [Streptomyces sp. WAC00276]|nr:hypothetical protein [Streptomyces sp. WAC00276]MCK2145488.1 hypothetical protein [Streptomyces sp. WAC00276]